MLGECRGENWRRIADSECGGSLPPRFRLRLCPRRMPEWECEVFLPPCRRRRLQRMPELEFAGLLRRLRWLQGGLWQRDQRGRTWVARHGVKASREQGVTIEGD